jgi:hypothetical protein
MTRAPIKRLPSLPTLTALLFYDAATGALTWKHKSGRSRSEIAWNNRCGGKAAGTVTFRGYIAIGIRKNGKATYYLAHRIIWKMMTGRDPKDQVDHRDGNRQNNRWLNLREAGNGPNLQNAKLRSDNRSGVKGVHWDARHKKWRAVISVDKRSLRLGRFNTILAAETAISAARKKLHGEFARLS